MTQFTKAVKKRVSAEWAALFPSLVEIEPGRLIKRHGPLLAGICLDGSPRDPYYVPRVHFHNLAREFPVISMSLASSVINRAGHPVRVPIDSHEEQYVSLAKETRARFPLLDAADLSFPDFVEFTERYVAGEFGVVVPYQLAPYEDVVLVAAYLDAPHVGREALNRYVAKMRAWPGRAFSRVGSVEQWQANLEEQLTNPDLLRKTARSEVEKFGIGALTDRGLLIGVPRPTVR